MIEQRIILENDIKKIVINKKGDSIEIDMNNRENFDKLIETLQCFINKSKRISKDPDLKYVNELCDYGEQQLKSIYGDNIIISIFNVEHPSIRALTIFYLKLLKILSDFNEEVNAKTMDEIEKTYGSKYLDRAKIKEKIGN